MRNQNVGCEDTHSATKTCICFKKQQPTCTVCRLVCCCLLRTTSSSSSPSSSFSSYLFFLKLFFLGLLLNPSLTFPPDPLLFSCDVDFEFFTLSGLFFLWNGLTFFELSVIFNFFLLFHFVISTKSLKSFVYRQKSLQFPWILLFYCRSSHTALMDADILKSELDNTCEN